MTRTKVHNCEDDVDVQQELRKKGLKITNPRRIILENLVQNHGPFTVNEIFDLVSKDQRINSCDLATVYRCLTTFEKAKLVTRCNFGDSFIRYEYQCKEHHHHIICKECKRVETVNICPVDETTYKIPTNDFKNITHKLEFFGVCPDCYK